MPGPPPIPTANAVTINAARLLAELHHLSHLTDCPPNADTSFPAPTQAVTRIVFTPRDLEARAWLANLAETSGFSVRTDAVGNTFLRWQGSDPTLPAVGTGSHTDAIPHAGMYDGTVGVLGGLEAMRSLKESGFTPRRSIETVMFTSEEPTRFGIGCLGSRLMAGVLDPTTADALPDRIEEVTPGAPSSPAASSQARVGSQDAPSVSLHGTDETSGAPSSPAASSQARVGPQDAPSVSLHGTGETPGAPSSPAASSQARVGPQDAPSVSLHGTGETPGAPSSPAASSQARVGPQDTPSVWLHGTGETPGAPSSPAASSQAMVGPQDASSVWLHGTGETPGAPSSPAASSQARVGPHGVNLTLADVRTAAGFTGPLASVKLPSDYYAAWVELHIEQGPLLERAMQEARTHIRDERPNENQVPQGFSLGFHGGKKVEGALAPEPTILGLVTHIAAPASYRYTIHGLGGHAGALLMPDRRDALCAASELILSVERHTLDANAAAKAAGQSGVDSVATIGTIAVHPGAVNSVPSRVTLMLDIRDTDPDRRDRTMAALRADIRDIESRRGVTITEDLINADLPATSDPRILAALASACNQTGASHMPMVSRAYHDSTFMARIAPIAMLFIPCRNGVSHRPDEYATPEAITQGTQVLALTLAALASA